jgi:hypothetical protein
LWSISLTDAKTYPEQLSIASESAAPLETGENDREEVSGLPQTGLRTTEKFDAEPPSLRVDWIDWDSGFRDRGLLVGDDIIAIGGTRLGSDAARALKLPLPGQPGEGDLWKAQRLNDGDSVHLTVRRRQIPGQGWQEVVTTGTIRQQRNYLRGSNDRTLGLAGPKRLAKDDFPDAWVTWYDSLVFDWQRQLDRGTWNNRADSRELLARHMTKEARIRYLATHYPGRFASAVLADWELVRVGLTGRRYDVELEDYAYRDDDEKLVAEVTAAARAAWAAFQEVNADIIIAIPHIDVIADDIAKYAGKLVRLPPASPDNWISNSGVVMVSWLENGAWLFSQLEARALAQLWAAQLRYRRNISPEIADVFEMFGRILPAPRMVVPEGQNAVIGLEVEPVAALMGQEDALMFVDMSAAKDEAANFAGEDAVRVLRSAMPSGDASPQQVLEALINALHARDAETWFALFADWQFFSDGSEVRYNPYDPYPESSRDSDWAQSRQVVLERSYALRVVWVDEPRVFPADAASGLPLIEKVDAEIDHIGRFDGEFHAFNLGSLHRIWTLARRNGGPWRIATFQGI